MLSNIFDFLEKVKTGLTKPDSRITLEIYNMGNGDGLRFTFIWREGPYQELWLKINVFVPKDIIKQVTDIDFLADHVVQFANLELEKHNQETRNKSWS